MEKITTNIPNLLVSLKAQCLCREKKTEIPKELHNNETRLRNEIILRTYTESYVERNIYQHLMIWLFEHLQK